MTGTRETGLAICLLLAGLTLHAEPAQAHLLDTRFGDYYSGLLHPVTALQSLIAWLGLALLAGFQPARTVRWLVPVFPLAVAAGAAVGERWPGALQVSLANLFALLLLGLLASLGRRVSLGPLLALAVVFGFSSGYDNGLAMLPGGDALLFLLGVATAGYVVFTLAAAGAHTVVSARAWGSVAVQALGGWITAIGLMLVGVALLAPP